MGTTEKWTNSISPGQEQPDVLQTRLGRAKLGDAEAFSEIYDRYAGRILLFKAVEVTISSEIRRWVRYLNIFPLSLPVFCLHKL